MEHTRKWVLSPPDSESFGLSSQDVKLIISMFRNGFVNVDGELLSKSKGKYIPDSSVHDCLTQKAQAEHYARFLELKAQLKPLKRKRSKWEMNDD